MSTPPWRRGADIPASGVPGVFPLCMPDTWRPIISGLLEMPKRPYFWRDNADPADIEAAQIIAEDIAQAWESDACQCAAVCEGTETEDIFDFAAAGLGDWVLDDGTLGANGVEGELSGGGSSWEMQIQMHYSYLAPVRLVRFEITGTYSRFTFDPTICGASFVSASLGMDAYRDSLGPFAGVGFTLGAQYGSAPIGLVWVGPSCELVQDIYVSLNFTALTQACAETCVQIIEEIRITYLS